MDFDLLHTLMAVAETPNFRAAADRLGISQPAVTLKVRQLEALHPNPIFVMEGRRKVLTPYGRELYQRAKAGTQRLSYDLEDLKRSYCSAKHLKIRVGGRLDVLRYVAQWLDFGGMIEMVDCSSTEAVAQLLRHDLDMAISYKRPDSAHLQAKHLFRSHAYFRVHEKWLGKRALKRELLNDPEFLRTTPCILYGREDHLLRELFRKVDLDLNSLNIKFISESWSLIQSMVNEGVGYSIVPFYANPVAPEVRELEVPSSINEPYDFYAIYELGMRKMEAFRPLLSFAKLKKG